MIKYHKYLGYVAVLALALVVFGAGHAPDTYALTDAAITQLRQSSTDAIDSQTTNNLPTLILWLVGMVFAWGIVGIVLRAMRAGLATVGGRKP